MNVLSSLVFNPENYSEVDEAVAAAAARRQDLQVSYGSEGVSAALVYEDKYPQARTP